MAKKILGGLALILLVIIIWQIDMISYGLGQAKGQLVVVWNAKPIEHYLEDPTFDPALKEKINLIQEIRTFAIDSLGLRNSTNYTTIFDQHGKDILWNVSACEPYALNAYQWRFPIIGTFGYKGYFNEENAKAEQERLKQAGYDTQIYGVSAWSTLGWFKDPILSNMLLRSEGQLADLVIHELTHATIFVKDSLTFNENLASFVGHIGAIAYLTSKYGTDSEQLNYYLRNEQDNILYLQHMMNGAKSLDSLYNAIKDQPLSSKESLKSAQIQLIMMSLDTVSFYNKRRFVGIFEKSQPNNASLMSYLRYHSSRDLLEAEYLNNFGGHIRAYLLHLKGKYGVLE